MVLNHTQISNILIILMNINQLMQPIVLLLLMLICIESPPNEQTESNSDTEEQEQTYLQYMEQLLQPNYIKDKVLHFQVLLIIKRQKLVNAIEHGLQQLTSSRKRKWKSPTETKMLKEDDIQRQLEQLLTCLKQLRKYLETKIKKLMSSVKSRKQKLQKQYEQMLEKTELQIKGRHLQLDRFQPISGKQPKIKVTQRDQPQAGMYWADHAAYRPPTVAHPYKKPQLGTQWSLPPNLPLPIPPTYQPQQQLVKPQETLQASLSQSVDLVLQVLGPEATANLVLWGSELFKDQGQLQYPQPISHPSPSNGQYPAALSPSAWFQGDNPEVQATVEKLFGQFPNIQFTQFDEILETGSKEIVFDDNNQHQLVKPQTQQDSPLAIQHIQHSDPATASTKLLWEDTGTETIPQITKQILQTHTQTLTCETFENSNPTTMIERCRLENIDSTICYSDRINIYDEQEQKLNRLSQYRGQILRKMDILNYEFYKLKQRIENPSPGTQQSVFSEMDTIKNGFNLYYEYFRFLYGYYHSVTVLVKRVKNFLRHSLKKEVITKKQQAFQQEKLKKIFKQLTIQKTLVTTITNNYFKILNRAFTNQFKFVFPSGRHKSTIVAQSTLMNELGSLRVYTTFPHQIIQFFIKYIIERGLRSQPQKYIKYLEEKIQTRILLLQQCKQNGKIIMQQLEKFVANGVTIEFSVDMLENLLKRNQQILMLRQNIWSFEDLKLQIISVMSSIRQHAKNISISDQSLSSLVSNYLKKLSLFIKANKVIMKNLFKKNLD